MKAYELFVQQSISRLEENIPRIEKCLNQLSEDKIWLRPNVATNSVGNLILHLNGNVTQYIISSMGHNPDIRHRDEEFFTRGGFSKKELFEKISSTVRNAAEVLDKVDKNELLRVRVVQGFDMSGIDIIVHVVEHFSFHTGQIVFLTKLFSDKDLEFYKGRDLNKKNE